MEKNDGTHPAVRPGGQKLDHVVLARGRGVVERRAPIGIERDHILGERVEHRNQRRAPAHRGEVQERLEAVVSENGTGDTWRLRVHMHATIIRNGVDLKRLMMLMLFQQQLFCFSLI